MSNTMLNCATKNALYNKAYNKLVDYINSLDTDKAESFMYEVWNAFCESRGVNEDELFSFADKKDINLWITATNGEKFDYVGGKHYGRVIVEYSLCKTKLHIFQYDTNGLIELILSNFRSIYNYVIIEPKCYPHVMSEIVLWDIWKEIGILNPWEVGFHSDYINDELLKEN